MNIDRLSQKQKEQLRSIAEDSNTTESFSNSGKQANILVALTEKRYFAILNNQGTINIKQGTNYVD